MFIMFLFLKRIVIIDGFWHVSFINDELVKD